MDHLTKEQRAILDKARELSERLAHSDGRIELHYNKSLVFGVNAKSGFLDNLEKENSILHSQFLAIINSREYADAVEADTL
jgi:bacterioferritin (cytochrome b1)